MRFTTARFDAARFDTVTRTPRAKVAGGALGLALLSALVLSGCTVGATSPVVAPVQAPLPSPTESATGLPDGIAPPAAAPEAALPAGVAPDSDAALAWQALMSPVGEYAAAASYLAVLDQFGMVEPYATILDDELRHIDALTRQLDRAGVAVPDNPYLGVVVAPQDLQTAADAWAAGEVNNVAMYDELLAQAESERLVMVLGNLRRASLESHLPAFTAAAAAGGTLDAMPAHSP